jgi:tetratricopeptide (TPR) repeat protein
MQDADAAACFSVCITLRPEFHWSWYNRGLVHLRLRHHRQAVDDFDRALLLNPALAEGYVGRAKAREGMKEYGEAIADYTKALDRPAASTEIYFLRAKARTSAGDLAGARRDYDAGLAAEPTDELGWIARGLARRESDPAARRESDPIGALADFEQALKLNPRSFDGMQNKAALLSDQLGRDAEAIEVLDQAVNFYPESVLARGGRGVLLARVGKRAGAVEDARACLLLDSGPSTLYQVACIYALTSKQTPNDRLQAMPLLSAALRAGFGLEFVDHDTDLDTLRPLPEFKRLVAAARALHSQPATPAGLPGR